MKLNRKLCVLFLAFPMACLAGQELVVLTASNVETSSAKVATTSSSKFGAIDRVFVKLVQDADTNYYTSTFTLVASNKYTEELRTIIPSTLRGLGTNCSVLCVSPTEVSPEVYATNWYSKIMLYDDYLIFSSQSTASNQDVRAHIYLTR